MGCGNSKLTSEGELVPPRIRPLLRGKFSELKKRKNGISNLSKKVLLNDRELDEENSMFVENRKSSSPNCLEKDERLPIPRDNTSTHRINATKDETGVVQEADHELKHNETRRELKQRKTMDEDQHKCIEEGGDNEDNRCPICPGSPSFRFYFVEETKNDEEMVEIRDAAADMEDVSQSHNKSPSQDSVESTTYAKLGEGREKKLIKKGKKGTSLHRVISKKRPVGVGVGVGVKNLLNVRSCYHLSCSGHERANLLARKAEA